ncbi:hypothetical protein TIFTF001_002832 [Ficus carica]|uniref:Uncharacterized protein n=1 Tax=Ficus carica TaxID=3494 RepID=A0AA88D8Z5_FICCA|nr:hypothetical protein TIFTF001_002832 [Ficus carica]
MVPNRGKKSDDLEDAGANVIGIGGIGADLRTRIGTGDAIGNDADAACRSDLAIITASSCEESTTAVTATPPHFMVENRTIILVKKVGFCTNTIVKGLLVTSKALIVAFIM